MSNSTTLNDNVNVKQVATLFEEVQGRYLSKLLSIDQKHLPQDERYKVERMESTKASISLSLSVAKGLDLRELRQRSFHSNASPSAKSR